MRMRENWISGFMLMRTMMGAKALISRFIRIRFMVVPGICACAKTSVVTVLTVLIFASNLV